MFTMEWAGNIKFLAETCDKIQGDIFLQT